MVVTPNRLEQVRDDLEQGNPVDLNKVAALQGLDIAIAGRQFAEQAANRDRKTDDNLKKQFEA